MGGAWGRGYYIVYTKEVGEWMEDEARSGNVETIHQLCTYVQTLGYLYHTQHTL